MLVTERDFHDLTLAYLRRVAADGARHVEVFFDPQSHVPRGVPFEDVVGGITTALREGEAELGVSWRLIMCFLRHRPASEAMEMLDLAMAHRNVVVGVGLDSAEIGHPPADFAEVYEKARAAGFVAVAHAGEEGPPAYISEALDVLKVRRIDHGVAAAGTPFCSGAWPKSGIPLTMCPLSNLELQVTPDLAQHPLKRLLDAGLVVTVNSDDPAYFGGYLLRQLRSRAAGAGPELRRPGPAGAQLDHRVAVARGPQGRAARRDRPGAGRDLSAAERFAAAPRDVTPSRRRPPPACGR